MKLNSDERHCVYRSGFVDELRAKRDVANGTPENQIGTKFPGVESLWRREIDPCRRNMVRFELEHHDQYQSRWSALQYRKREILAAESAVHRSCVSEGVGFEMEERFEVFRCVMERDAGMQGFGYDLQKSRREYPVYTKMLTDQWHLCWTLSHLDMFALSPQDGIINFTLDLRSAGLAGTTENARAGEFLLFRFQGILPGFNDAYRKFVNLEEQETILKAHLTMYKVISPILESAVVDGLAE